MKQIFFIIFILLLGNQTNGQQASDLPQKGLQAFWPFSGAANDVSGNNRHGTPYGATLAKDRFGNEQSAYYFNGVSDFITTPYEGVLGTLPRAVSFWAIVSYNTNYPKGTAGISWGNNAQFPNAGGRFNCCFGSCWTCDPKDKFIGATIDVADAGATYEGQEAVTDGRWHHYVFQFDKKYVKDVEVYQDGLLLTHEPYRFYENNLINTRPSIDVTFGALFLPEDTTAFFMGLLDDIAIYDRALSPREINLIYTLPDPKKKTDHVKWMLPLLALVTLTFLIIWLIRLRVNMLVNREKEKIQLEKKWYEQENRVLKAQMDPHFIFNALNSIQQFIVVHDNEKAQLYLSTFAQLIRMQLESNTNEDITLAQEIEILEKYLEIELLRFNNAFDYEIIVDKGIDTASVYIPYFLMQPFVENAIHHGLLPKHGYKELTITIEKEDEKTLKCTVEDNGIGRKNALSKETSKTKSLGVNFVEQRLLIMSKIENRKYSVEITDKEDEKGNSKGTHAVITLPIQTK